MKYSWLLFVVLLGGCHTGKLPDPNDPKDEQMSPHTLRANLRSVSEALIERRLKNEFDNEEYKRRVAQAAVELIKEMDLTDVDPSEAWEYGEVLRAGKNWKAAKDMLVIAVRHAKLVRNQDRFVNDSLRLAQVEAELGDVEGAVKEAKTVMDARPRDSAPILLAVLYEIVPPARGKGHDAELAELLEQAVQKHIRTVVDQDTAAGRDFLIARSHHVSAAYGTIAELYESAGRHDEALKAARKGKWAATDIEGFIASELAQTPSGEAEAPPTEGQSRL